MKIISRMLMKQLLIPQEKILATIKFKPPTFVIPPPKDIVLLKNNYSISPLSNLGFPSFLPKKNLFFSKTTPMCLEKGNSLLYLLLPPFPPSSPSSPSSMLLLMKMSLTLFSTPLKLPLPLSKLLLKLRSPKSSTVQKKSSTLLLL